MKFFMVSKCGEGAGLLDQIQNEGNSCRIWIREKDYRTVYDGILTKVKSISPEKDEIVIFDSSGMGDVAQTLIGRGHKVFGASAFHDKLENSRSFGLDFMKKAGISVPKTFDFKKNQFSLAKDVVNRSPNERFVFKPSGDLPSHLTYVSEDAEDLCSYMDFVEKNYSNRIQDFVLQEFIEGTAVSSEFWCGPGGFVRPGNQTIEVKKFLNGDLGPSTGCQGNLIWLREESSVFDRGILKVEKALVENGYIGPIDLNCIVTEKDVFGLEWTPRFGLDAMPTFLQLLSQEAGKLISDMIEGKVERMDLIDGNFAAGIRLSIPPYPLEPPDAKMVQQVSPNLHIPIKLPEEHANNYYFYEIMVKDGQFVHSDGSGIIAVVSFLDSDPQKAFYKCEEPLEKAKIPNKEYRTDLAECISEKYNEFEDNELCLD